MTKELAAVYYPNPVIPNEEFLKIATLYFDQIILPNDYSEIAKALKSDEVMKEYLSKGDDVYYEKTFQKKIKEVPGFMSYYAKQKFLQDTKVLRKNGLLRLENFLIAYRTDSVMAKVLDTVFQIVLDPETRSLIDINYPFLNSKRYDKPLFASIPPLKENAQHIELVLDLIRTFCVSQVYGYSLISDRLEARDLLNRVTRLLVKKKLKITRSDWKSDRKMRVSQSDWNKEKQQQLGIAVFEYTLPNVTKLTYEEIVNLKEELKDSLASYRSKMWELAKYIEQKPYNIEYEQKVEEVINNCVVPEILQLEREMRSSRKKFIREVCQKILWISPITFILSSAKNFPYTLPLSVLASLGFELKEYLDERKRIGDSNGLSFLLKVGKGPLEKFFDKPLMKRD